jgi:hypothetical protein
MAVMDLSKEELTEEIRVIREALDSGGLDGGGAGGGGSGGGGGGGGGMDGTVDLSRLDADVYRVKRQACCT